MTRPEAIKKIAQASVAVEKANHCPAEILFAQTAVESDWLNSAPGNNCLGYKDYPGSYGKQLLMTTERLTDQQKIEFLKVEGREIVKLIITAQDGTNTYEVRDWFATFPSIEACMAVRAGRWVRGSDLPWVKAFYTTATPDWSDLFFKIAQTGYATASPTLYSKGCVKALQEPGALAAIQAARQGSNEGLA